MDPLMRKGMSRLFNGVSRRVMLEYKRLPYLKQGWNVYNKTGRKWKYRIMVRYSDWMIERGLRSLEQWHYSIWEIGSGRRSKK